MSFKHDDCIMIIGRRGCGKTYLGKNLKKLWPRKIIIDTLNDHESENTVTNFSDFTKRLDELKQNNTENFELVFRFDPESRISETEFDEICRLVWYFKNVQLVAEEVQSHASPHYISHWFKNLMLKGRHHGISVLATTQRPGELHKSILSQCEHIFCGSLVEPNDINYMSKIFSTQHSKILGLQDRKFLYKSKSGVFEVSNDF